MSTSRMRARFNPRFRLRTLLILLTLAALPLAWCAWEFRQAKVRATVSWLEAQGWSATVEPRWLKRSFWVTEVADGRVNPRQFTDDLDMPLPSVFTPLWNPRAEWYPNVPAELFTRIETLPGLKKLTIVSRTIVGQDLADLARLESVEVVAFVNCEFEGGDQIDILHRLPQLRTLCLEWTNASDSAIHRFQRARPDVNIVRR